MGHQPRASSVQAMVLGTTELPRKAVGRGLFSPRGSFFADSQGDTELGFRDRAGVQRELGRVIAQFLTPQAPQKDLFPF